MRKNWSLEEIEAVVFSHPEVKKDWPLRSIEIIDRETITVLVGNFGFLSGGGQRVTLRLQADGTWKIEKVEGFDS